MGAGLLLCLMGLLFCATVASAAAPAKQLGVVGQQAVQPDAPADCALTTAVPASECRALVAFYVATGGPTWKLRTNWLNGVDERFPCNWYGVICGDSHVTGLQLASNNLRGPLPASLGQLSWLTGLQLADNQLAGDVPPAICELADSVLSANLGHNQLQPERAVARACLNAIDPDWASTQTVPPRHLAPVAFAADSIQLNWTPILYTGDGGFYEVSVATSRDGVYTVHGVTADKNADGYLLDGLDPGKIYYIRVRTHTPATGPLQTEQWSQYATLVAVSQANTDPVLLMVYFPADNDLSPYIESVVRRIQKGTSVNPNVKAFLLADGRGENDTSVFEIAAGQVVRTNAVQSQWGVGELDTTDPEVLAWFLTHARQQTPASKSVVSLMGHGLGPLPEFEWLVADASGEAVNPTPDGLPPLPKGIEHTPGDVTDAGGYMSTLDFGNALSKATNGGADPFDIVFFDQCFQGNVDVLYQVRNSADLFIASPNYAWLVAAYHQYLTQFTPDATAQEMAQAIIQIYQSALDEHHPNVIFWLNAGDIGTIAEAVSALGDKLRQALANGGDAAILRAALDSQFVDTTQCGSGNLELGPPDELLGAGSFAANLQGEFGAGDADGVHAAAQALIDALAAVRSSSHTGQPYLAPQTTWEYEDTLTIMAPLQRDLTTRTIWRASVYGESPPVTAVWREPSQTVEISSNFAFVDDGKWDEFIDAWYTAPLPPTVGEWCHYIPPVLATDGLTDTLQLTATESSATESNAAESNAAESSAGLELNWTETDEEKAAEYWLLSKKSDDVGWRLMAALPLTQTTYATSLPAPGETQQFVVIAQDGLGAALARSNQVSWLADHQLYLPLIAR
ncbi:MAG: hypothetical protein HC802_13645 [Caldilineaceae bacterium]|nr:hypothetical protein [Caldilineaceae bacterium]